RTGNATSSSRLSAELQIFTSLVIMSVATTYVGMGRCLNFTLLPAAGNNFVSSSFSHSSIPSEEYIPRYLRIVAACLRSGLTIPASFNPALVASPAGGSATGTGSLSSFKKSRCLSDLISDSGEAPAPTSAAAIDPADVPATPAKPTLRARAAANAPAKAAPLQPPP